MTGRRSDPDPFRRPRMGRAQRESLAVQVAVVGTGLVIGLVPLTAPLPAMSAARASVLAVVGLVLATAVALLGVMVLVPARARQRTSGRVLLAAAAGAIAAGVGYAVTAGLITRPLLLVAATALVLLAGDTAVSRR